MEVSTEYQVISVDINQTDPNILKNYIKDTYKNEFFFVDANDFLDVFKTIKVTSETDDLLMLQSQAIAHAIKTFIDSTLQKNNEIKKKNQKASENPKQSNKGQQHPPSQHEAFFLGQCEIIFCLLNFPLTGAQFKMLADAGVNVVAFFNIHSGQSSQSPDALAQNQTNSSKALRKPQFVLPYNNIIGKFVSNTITPLRWQYLKQEAGKYLIFLDLLLEGEPQQMWSSLQNEIGKLIKFHKFYQEKMKDIKYIDIPVASGDVATEIFRKCAKEYPNNLINGIYSQLKENNWKIAPGQPETDYLVIDTMLSDITPTVVFPHKRGTMKIPLELEVPKECSIAPFIKKLKKWTLTAENTEGAVKSAEILSSIEGFNTAAGQQFDAMIAKVNKQYQLGLPNSFYDWTKWTRMVNKENSMDFLESCVNNANIVEVNQDPVTGIMYVLTLQPAQKQQGKAIVSHYVPSFIESANEYFENVYDEETVEKKSRSLPTPAQLLKSGQDVTTIFPQYKELVDQKKEFYTFPITYNFASDYTSPYLMQSGTEIDVHRNVWNKNITFNYDVKTKNVFSARSTSDSIAVDFGGIRAFNFADSTVIENGNNTFVFAEGKLTVSSPSHKVVLSLKGDLSTKNEENKSFVCTKNGIVGLENESGTILFSTADGFFFSRGAEKTKMHKTTDPLSKTVTLIREDGIEYHITKKQERLISHEFVSVKQIGEVTEYSIEELPLIKVDESNAVSFKCGSFDVVFNETGVAIRKEGFDSLFNKEKVVIHAGDEFVLKPEVVQIKSGQSVFYADNKGDERLSTIATTEPPPKKKLEFIETMWGLLAPVKDVLPENVLLEQQKTFPPHFFAIRNDCSFTEFIYTELTVPSNREVFENKVSIDGKEVTFVSYVSEKREVDTFIDFPPLDKPKRTAMMKEACASRGKKKPKKGETLPDVTELKKEADAKLLLVNEFFKKVSREAENASEKACATYGEVHKPLPPKQPDVFKIPPCTPQPNVLIAANRKLVSLKKPEEINFWDSPEAEFIHVMEVTIHKPRPPSSRTKLFDPPRNFTTTEKDLPPIQIEEPQDSYHLFETSITPRQKFSKARARDLTGSVASSARGSSGRNPNVQYYSKSDHENKVDFGDVPVGKVSHAILDITNTSSYPLKYTLLQPSNKSVKILTPPGIVQAGFKLKIKVSLLCNTVGPLETTFRLVTPNIDMEVPVLANVVQE